MGVALFPVMLLLASTGGAHRGREEVSPLFSISPEGKFGCLDKTGNLVIAPQFDGAGVFPPGLPAEFLSANLRDPTLEPLVIH